MKYFSKSTLLFAVILFSMNFANGQIGIGIIPPHPSAALHVQDTSRGILVPRMTSVQRRAIMNPAEGLLVYQTDSSSGFFYYSNSHWRNLTQNQFIINVTDYGVIGDSATDNTTALRALFAMASANGGIIHFPKGNYLISDTITVPYACKITGVGGGAPYLGTEGVSHVGVYAYGTAVLIQKASNKSALVITHDGVSIEGMTLKCTGIAPSAGSGIMFRRGHSLRLSNTFIGYFYNNLTIAAGVDWMVWNNQFVNPINYNMFVGNNIPDEGCNTVYSNMFNSSLSGKATQLRIEAPAGIRIVSNEFHIATGMNVASEFYPIGVIDIYSYAATSAPFISNNNIEAYTQFGLRIRMADDILAISKIMVNGNSFQGYSQYVHDIDIQSNVLGKIHTITVVGNNFANSGYWSSIYMRKIKGITISGNSNSANDSAYTLRSDSLVDCSGVMSRLDGVVLLDSIRQKTVPPTATAGSYDFIVRNSTTGNYQKVASSGVVEATVNNNFTTYQTVTRSTLGSTPQTTTGTVGLSLYNSTPAALGAQQQGPSIYLPSQGWGTTTGSSRELGWWLFSSPAQGTVPTSRLRFQSGIDGAAVTNAFILDAAGNGTFEGAVTTSLGNIALRANLAGASSDAYLGWNLTAATLAVPVQNSPRVRLAGSAWNGSASQTADFTMENKPFNGTSPITTNLVFSSQIASGGYNEVFRVNNFGKVSIQSGANGSSGTATLVAGMVTVKTTQATTGCKIFYSVRTPAGTQGFLSVPTSGVTNGLSFVINSTSASENSTVDWWIIN
ncbi:MAG: glycosyl hydrolase family 28-related protein [Ferruginibacter sp.]